ncbi:MAG: phosphotransferase [Planctomycetota bacterium]|jgi:heptose I phosphotransferase|nr:phosphotransferase [Planctomycetota bacterium]
MLRAVFRRLFSGKKSARAVDHEWRVLCRLSEAGVAVPRPVAFGATAAGRDGWSFLIIEELTPTVTAEKFFADKNAPKRAACAALGKAIGAMHRAGVYQRDSHGGNYLLFREPAADAAIIDFHTARVFRKLPLRYREKEWAELLFSSLAYDFFTRDYWRFLRAYFPDRSLRETLIAERETLTAMRRRIEKRLLRKVKHRQLPAAVAILYQQRLAKIFRKNGAPAVAILDLREPFSTLWRGKDAFAEVEKLPVEITGGVDDGGSGRRIWRTVWQGEAYYVKTILPLAWRQKVFPNWRDKVWRCCRRILRLGEVAAFDVAHEWRLLLRLQECGVLAPAPVAFGARGDDYSGRVFIITKALTPTAQLAEVLERWRTLPQARKLLAAFGEVVGAMHRAGIRHCDNGGDDFLVFTGGKPRVAVIDFGDSRLWKIGKMPRRCRAKEIAALLTIFGGKIALTRREELRFLRAYFPDRSLRETLTVERELLAAVRRYAVEFDSQIRSAQ